MASGGGFVGQAEPELDLDLCRLVSQRSRPASTSSLGSNISPGKRSVSRSSSISSISSFDSAAASGSVDGGEWLGNHPNTGRRSLRLVCMCAPGTTGEREVILRVYMRKLQAVAEGTGLTLVPTVFSELSETAAGHTDVLLLLLRAIDRCDVFVGLSAARYGWNGATSDSVLASNFDVASKV